MNFYEFIFINGLYLLFSCPFFLIVYLFSRYYLKYKEWTRLDILFVLPGLFYYLLVLLDLDLLPKTLANYVSELMWIGFGCSLLFIFRVLFGYFNFKAGIYFSIIPAFILVVLVFFITAPIPE
jgi:hypothetical protein